MKARFITGSVMRQLTAIFIVGALIVVGLTGYLSFHRARAALEKSEFDKLLSMWGSKDRELLSWFHSVVNNASFLAQNIRVQASVQDWTNPDIDPDQVRYGLTGLSQFFKYFLDINSTNEGFEDLLIIDGKTGKIHYTQKKLPDHETNLKMGKLKDTGLAKVWAQVVKFQKPAISDFGIYPVTGKPAAFVAVPVYSRYPRKFLGVLAVRINAKVVNRIVSLVLGLSKTTEFYLVGQDLLMRCQSRFNKESTMIKMKVDTEPVNLAFRQGGVYKISKNPRGDTTLTVSRVLGFSKQKAYMAGFDWVLVCEVTREEAMQGATDLAKWVLGIAIFITALVTLVAFFLARSVTKPVVAIAKVATAVSHGDLTVDVPSHSRSDEFGSLNDAFELMVRNLREQIRMILEGVNILASTATEISATISQLGASASRTSTAVTETTTTIEQVKQAAKLSSEKAKNVAEISKRAAEISESGKEATEDAVQRMDIIKNEVESISGTIVKLSEQSQAIEGIISAVQDLADQSNLLAVNASIEAVRAGEYGTGFTVVAQEIKNLADQSKESTEKVRTLLSDIRKRVAAAVTATEEADAAVDAGVEQSALAGESIKDLLQNVSESAQAAALIVTSSEQQFVGVDQVASAMANVEKAMKQNLESTTHIQDAAKRLEELGHSLKQMVEYYRV